MASFAVSKSAVRAETSVAAGSKTWAWLGLGSAILGILVTWSVQLLIPQASMEAGGQALLGDLDTTRNEVFYRVTSGLGYILSAGLVVYGIGLYRHLDRKAGGSSIIPAVLLGSFIITAASLAIAMSFRAQVFDGISYYAGDPSSHVTMQRLSQDSVLTAWATLFAGITAVAVGGLKGTLFPKGMGIFSAIVLVPMTLLLLGGVAFPAGAMVALPWFLVFAAWGVRQPVLD